MRARKTCRKCGARLQYEEDRAYGYCIGSELCDLRATLRRKSKALRVARALVRKLAVCRSEEEVALADIRRAERGGK
jgi:hypothetical protein